MASEEQLDILNDLVRASSAVSFVGCILLITSFIWEPACRKPINRLAFFAAWGNLIVLVATVIGDAGYKVTINKALPI
jgi:hypothetical protein